MKKTILALAAVSTCAFASPFRGMGSNSSENLVSSRFGKVTTTSVTETKEKGDGDIVDSIPKEQINTRPTLADLNRNVRTGASVPSTYNGKYALLQNALNRLLNASYSYLDVPYVWGGTTRKGLDCSAFVKNAYSEIGITLPRVSRYQAQVGRSVSLSAMRPGDLMFFYTDSSRPNTVTHVGMYIGKNKIIHASSSNKKVIIANLNNGYFLNKLAGIKRIIDVTA